MYKWFPSLRLFFVSVNRNMLRLHLFFDKWACIALSTGLRQFSICSPFPSVIVISPVSKQLFYVF
jgi:hypothetical protein